MSEISIKFLVDNQRWVSIKSHDRVTASDCNRNFFFFFTDFAVKYIFLNFILFYFTVKYFIFFTDFATFYMIFGSFVSVFVTFSSVFDTFQWYFDTFQCHFDTFSSALVSENPSNSLSEIGAFCQESQKVRRMTELRLVIII